MSLVENLRHKLAESIAPNHKKEIGVTGTEVFGGKFDEEDISRLQGTEGIDIYIEMRRSDEKIREVLMATKNPIISADWFIEPVDDSEEEKKIAEFIGDQLFKNICRPKTNKKKSWTAFVKEALTMIEFGYSVFEIVHRQVVDDPKWGDFVGLADIAWRSPQTIEDWNLRRDGSIESIRQCVDGDLVKDDPSGGDFLIPGEFLLVLSHDKEGDNYEGISGLRYCYRIWLLKNDILRLYQIGLKRTVNGIPILTYSRNYKDDDLKMTAVKNTLTSYANGNIDWMTLPEGFTIEDFKVKADNGDITEILEYLDKGISEAFAASFINMGSSSSGGSFALGTDRSDMFLSGLELIPEQIIEQVNQMIIKPLVDAKFGKRQIYPGLRVAGINDKAGEERAGVLKTLVDGGLIQNDDRLKTQIQGEFNLPDFIPGEETDEPDDDAQEDEDLSEHMCQGHHNLQELGPETKAKSPPVKLMKEITIELNDNFMAGQTFRSDKMLATIEKKLRKGASRLDILTTPLPDRKRYQDDILNITLRGAVKAKDQVIGELKKGGLTSLQEEDNKDLLGKLPKDTRERIKAENQLLIDSQDTRLKEAVFFAYNNEVDHTDSVDALMRNMTVARDRYLNSQAFPVGAADTANETVNGVRNDVFQTPQVFNQIQVFVYRNDVPVSAICQNLNGRVFSKEEYNTTSFLPPNHHRCDAYIEPITIEQPTKELSPTGLQPTGTEDQVGKILKSKTL